MTKYTGRDIKVGIAKEATRGQGGAATYWIPHRSFDLDYKVTTIVDDQSYGVIEDSTDVRVVAKWAEGNLSGIVRDRAIGLLLLNALGTPTDVKVVEAGAVYRHTFQVLQSHQHPSLSLSVEDEIEDRIYPRTMLSSLKIVAELGEYVLFTAGMMSETGSPQSVTPVYAAENEFAADDLAVRMADDKDGLSVTGSPEALKLKSVSITIEKELERDNILGSVNPDDILNKTVRATVEITKAHEDDAFKDRFNGGSPFALRIEMKSDATIGTSSNPKLQFDLNKVVITDWSTAKDLDGLVTETFTAKANFKIADSEMIEAILVNTVASY